MLRVSGKQCVEVYEEEAVSFVKNGVVSMFNSLHCCSQFIFSALQILI